MLESLLDPNDEYTSEQIARHSKKISCSFTLTAQSKVLLESFAFDTGLSASHIVQILVDNLLTERDVHIDNMSELFKTEKMLDAYQKIGKSTDKNLPEPKIRVYGHTATTEIHDINDIELLDIAPIDPKQALEEMINLTI